MSSFYSDNLLAADDSEEEYARTRALFEELKEKAINDESMTEVEKNDFCLAVALSRLDDGVWEDYSCCDDYKFYYLYLTYYRNIADGTKYYKTDRDLLKQITIEDYNKIMNLGSFDQYWKEVGREEVKSDLNYLYKKADEWDTIMQIRNHSDEILKAVSEEAREELRGLNKHTKKLLGNFAFGRFKYKKERRAILLHLKYIYLQIKAMKQKYNSTDFIIDFFGEDVYIDAETIVHVMNRHFAEGVRQYPYKHRKTYHTTDIDPKLFHLQLKDIFANINNVVLKKSISMDKVVVKWNNVYYYISVGNANLFIKNEKTKKIKRITTFYPLEILLANKILNSNYQLYEIDDNLSVYLYSK